MTPSMYAFGAVLTLIALAFIVVPLLRHRKHSAVGVALTTIVVLLPLCAALMYSNVSNYSWKEDAIVSDVDSATEQPVNELIVELAQRLETKPELEGFILLGRSYMSLQRYPDAVDAWHRAWEMSKGESAEVSLNYAESLILADKRTLTTSAADLLDKVLVVIPDDPRALWYGGLSAASRQLNDVAIDRFMRLLKADLPENMRTVVQTQLAQLGVDPGALDQPVSGEEGIPVTGGISATVSVASEVAGLVRPGALLFVFARDGEKPGPPIAVKRMPLPQLPFTTTLTDADAMVQGASLGKADQLKLVARISLSGNPIAEPGDLYGEALVSGESGDSPVSVVIDRITE